MLQLRIEKAYRQSIDSDGNYYDSHYGFVIAALSILDDGTNIIHHYFETYRNEIDAERAIEKMLGSSEKLNSNWDFISSVNMSDWRR